MRRAAATLLLLLLLLPLAAQLCLASPGEVPEIPRHTPGFPTAVITGPAGEELLKILQELAQAQGVLNESTGISDVLQSPGARRDVEEGLDALEASGALPPEEVRAFREVLGGGDVYDLLRLVKDQELRRELRRLYSSGASPQDLARAIELVEKLRAEGRIGLGDYVAAMEILRRIAEAHGYRREYDAADKAVLEGFRELLSSSSTREALKTLLEGVQPRDIARVLQAAQAAKGIELPELSWFSNMGSAGGASPRLPAIAPALTSLPSLGIESLNMALAVIGIVAAIALAAYLAHRFGPVVAARLRLAAAGLGGAEAREAGLPKPIRIYWESVSVVSAVTRIPKRDAQTHREYLEAVKPRLGALAQPFERVTHVYEVSRYGGVLRPDMEREAEEAYRRLRGGSP